MVVIEGRGGRRRWDIREPFLRRPKLAVAAFVALWVLFGVGNVLTPKGAILENALVNPDDPYRRMDDQVGSRKQLGFRGQGDRVPFLLYFENGIRTVDDLRRIRDFSNRVRRELGDPVVSLSTFPYFVDDGEGISSDPHIPEDLSSGFDVEAWKDRVREDPSVYGVLTGRNFEYAVVVWFLDPDADEVAMFHRVAEFLEGRKISAIEWLYKTDITPPKGVGVGGRIVLDGLIDQGMNVDVFLLVGLGITLTFPVFVFAFRSFYPALLAVLVVVLSGILWTRGSIGLLAALGFPIKERVYCLLAYANCIVQGVSFTLHRYEAFYEAIHDSAGTRGRGSDRASYWRLSRSIDGLILFTATIAILGFGTLYWFEVRAIRESGVLSAIGVIFILFNAVVLLPALDTVLIRTPVGSGVMEPRVERSVGWLSRLVASLSPWHTVGFLTACLVAAGALVGPAGLLPIWTRHVDFAGDTVVRSTAEFMNDPRRGGFDVIDLLVEPANDVGVRDPLFLADSAAYMARLRGLDGTREVVSVLTSVERVSGELLDEPLPHTLPESGAVFTTVEGGLERSLATALYYAGGIRISLQTGIERSDTMAAYIDTVLRLAGDEYPSLRVSSYGGRSLYPRWDHYIRYGKPLNVMSSQWVVVILFMLRIAWHNRRRPPHSAYLRPLAGGLLASVPFVFATCILVFLMVGVQIPLDAATAAITALAINAAIDFSIYLFDDFQESLASGFEAVGAAREAVRRKGRVILADMTLNFLCAVPLLVSRFSSLQHVGMIMPVMVIACAFGTLVLMASLLPLGVRTPGPVGASAEVQPEGETA